ncbi:histidine kinase [Stanieria cyanosphaera PCC 7437]|uniref:Adaptive-response sensory-kinase SasA n=1 Tax=Stanieria cyanosphaera (strain ATCC 29371 / PCC 7437) TaxID=111780 RepID=K9XW69_STAC7|nr:histidine kinase [Stanieria cyanosphaera]AFZ36783.1 histidine kinase [Stanieria cyanosphaera PCC 7437]
MLQSDSQQIGFNQDVSKPETLQLLLFVNEHPTSQEYIRRVKTYLENLQAEYPFELQVIEIGKQPHLVEHFKLIATPALVKINPLPRQTLTGSNLIDQLQQWWPRWQTSVQVNLQEQISEEEKYSYVGEDNSVKYSAELIRLSDKIFTLQREKEELQEQLRFKEQILAMLAHDLRSPLTAASIAVETLEISFSQPDQEKAQKLRGQLFKQARKQFQIMNKMIADLLQASKNVGSQLQIEPSKLYLQPLCKDIISQFSDRMTEKSQQLTADIPQDVPAVYADEELVRQVIINLLENAIKYTPEEGKINLSILHRTSQKVQLSLCDNGPGIPAAKQERIFEGHFRLKRDRSKEGYGLGLSLCRKIINSHYGQIWVDSVPGGGSCFHFTLPAYR